MVMKEDSKTRTALIDMLSLSYLVDLQALQLAQL